MGVLITICVIVVVLSCLFEPKDKRKAHVNSNNSSKDTTPKVESNSDKEIRYQETFMYYLEKKGVNCTNKLYSTRLSSMVVLPFKGKNLKKIQIVVDFSMMPDRVTITGWDFIFYIPEKQNAILAACNECNANREVHFEMCDYDAVKAIMETHVDGDSWCEQCEALARRLADIVDSYYPVFARAKKS